MKKNLLIISLLLCAALSGCFGRELNHSEPKESQNPASTQTAEAEKKKTKDIRVISSPKDVSAWEPMGKYTADVTGDGEDDIITLYTSAQRDRKGEMMWDDTQEWVLRVEAAEGVYDLYDERIHGYIYMSVSDVYDKDEDKKLISLYADGNSFHEIRDYMYNGNKFTETVAYSTDDLSTEGISEIYSSIPRYE